MLLLRVGFVQTGESEDHGPRWVGIADGTESVSEIAVGEVGETLRDDHDVGEFIASGDVLDGIVLRFVDAASVEEREDGSLIVGERIDARRAGAGSKAVADLGIFGTGEEADDTCFSRLGFSEEPEDGGRGLTAEAFDVGVEKPGVVRGVKHTPESIAQSCDQPLLHRWGKDRTTVM